jgi:hypothetical protein
LTAFFDWKLFFDIGREKLALFEGKKRHGLQYQKLEAKDGGNE